MKKVHLSFPGNPFRGGDGYRHEAPVREGGPAGSEGLGATIRSMAERPGAMLLGNI